MKILITGAFGNLGLMCVEQALRLGHTIRCFDIDTALTRKAAANFSNKVEVIFGDIRNTELLHSLVKDMDAIIHNASLLPPLTDTLPELADAINITACQQLISIAEQQIKKPVFIFPSSVTVFGLPVSQNKICCATDEVIATDNYTRHKITIEQTLKTSTLAWVILRVGVSVDARTLKTDKATFKKLLNVKAENPLEYVHPKDVALAMCNAATHTEAHNKILLLGGGKSSQITQREFLTAAFEALGLHLNLSIHGKESFYTHWMDTLESQRILQFQKHDFLDYKKELAEKLFPLRILLFPLRWLINPLLNFLLR